MTSIEEIKPYSLVVGPRANAKGLCPFYAYALQDPDGNWISIGNKWHITFELSSGHSGGMLTVHSKEVWLDRVPVNIIVAPVKLGDNL